VWLACVAGHPRLTRVPGCRGAPWQGGLKTNTAKQCCSGGNEPVRGSPVVPDRSASASLVCASGDRQPGGRCSCCSRSFLSLLVCQHQRMTAAAPKFGHLVFELRVWPPRKSRLQSVPRPIVARSPDPRHTLATLPSSALSVSCCWLRKFFLSVQGGGQGGSALLGRIP
jgi:hypothetical protein